MNEIGDRLARTPRLQALITGHTDALGDPLYNLDLSRRRAQAVADYLAGLGIAADRLRMEGKGVQPGTDTDDRDRRRNSRMVEIAIVAGDE